MGGCEFGETNWGNLICVGYIEKRIGIMYSASLLFSIHSLFLIEDDS